MATKKTLGDLSGKWKMNTVLSSDPTLVLELQSVGALVRKLASHTPVSLEVWHQEESGMARIFIDQKITARVPATIKECYLDWQEREQSDAILGKVRSKSRWRNKGDLGEEYLKEGLEEDNVVQALVQSLERGWKAEQMNYARSN